MNLVDDLNLKELDQDELLDLLTRHSGDAKGDAHGWTVGGGVNEYKVRFDRHGSLSAITPGPNAHVSGLVARIDDELRSSDGTRVATSILFTDSASVRGGWRHGERFQILPAPVDFPRPEFDWADFPFLLQFAYYASPAAHVNSVRRAKIARQLELLLAILIRERVSQPEGRHRWMFVREPGPQLALRTEYLQPGYHVQDWESPADDAFISLNGVSPIDLTDFDSAITAGRDSVVLPARVDELAANYFALGSTERLAFDRAAQYFHIAQKSEETVLAWVALVGSIESLTPSSRDAPCPECGKPRPVGERCTVCHQGEGATQQFRETLEALAPSVSQEERSARTRLYQTRSRFAHGAFSLTDRVGFGVTAPTDHRRQTDLWYAFAIIRNALMSWLATRPDRLAK